MKDKFINAGQTRNQEKTTTNLEFLGSSNQETSWCTML
jgi:hypothetical protein